MSGTRSDAIAALNILAAAAWWMQRWHRRALEASSEIVDALGS